MIIHLQIKVQNNRVNTIHKGSHVMAVLILYHRVIKRTVMTRAQMKKLMANADRT